jgi:hypothetical protein
MWGCSPILYLAQIAKDGTKTMEALNTVIMNIRQANIPTTLTVVR